MKNLILALFTLISFSISANDLNPIPTTKKVDVATSLVTWTGKKVTGAHSGTLSLKSGSLDFDNGTLTGGSFQIDMTSLKNTDMPAGSKGAKNLEGHLKSDDFFGVPNHPTASFKIASVSPKEKGAVSITGDITIKGITQSITFDAQISANSATADIKIDRTKFDITYGSGSFIDNLGDKMIYDEFELAIDLKF